MLYLTEIQQLHDRAAALKLGKYDLYRRANVSVATVWRWQTGKNLPNLGTLLRAVAALRATVEAEEARLRGMLGTPT